LDPKRLKLSGQIAAPPNNRIRHHIRSRADYGAEKGTRSFIQSGTQERLEEYLRPIRSSPS
jgi:hypothetical protein